MTKNRLALVTAGVILVAWLESLVVAQLTGQLIPFEACTTLMAGAAGWLFGANVFRRNGGKNGEK